MLSPQYKSFMDNSPRKAQQNKQQLYLGKTCSTSAIQSDRQGFQQEQEQKRSSYSKILKQKEIKILKLTEKLKIAQRDLSITLKAQSTLQSDLKFFKQKIQQQIYNNLSLESEIKLINSKLKKMGSKLANIIRNNHRTQEVLPNFVVNSKDTEDEIEGLQLSKRMLKDLDNCISMFQKQKEHFLPCQYKEKLTTKFDSKQYHEQIENLRKQREFVNDLLVFSQKEKNTIANQVYQVTRKDFNTDFDRMTKAEVIKLTLELLAKLKECQNDRNSLEIELKAMKTTQLQKYQGIRQALNKLEKRESKPRIKKMTSLYN